MRLRLHDRVWIGTALKLLLGFGLFKRTADGCGQLPAGFDFGGGGTKIP